MLDSIYIGLTGLTGFSAGLRNISNNVANVNTPGFKGTELQFQDLFYRLQAGTGNGSDQAGLFLGSGLNTGSETILFKQGDLKQSGNDLDAAITGNGFFVMRDNGKTTFTRDGEFSIDSNGFLIARGGTARVAALVNGQLQDININDLRVNPGQATTTVNFAGDLTIGDPDKTHVISSLVVFDRSGASHTLRVTFDQKVTDPTTTPPTVNPNQWTIKIEDADAGNLVDNTGELHFSGNTLLPGFDTHTFTFTPAGGTPMNITFDFGTPGSFTGTTNLSGTSQSTLAVSSKDGFAIGSLTKTTFDENGVLTLTYSNGQTVKSSQLALAWFEFLQGLQPSGQSSFENNTGLQMQLGTAQTSLFGKVTAGSIEGSNVDLGQEFTDLIVVQRGYQASSQVISVANEMIQQLLDIQKGAGG